MGASVVHNTALRASPIHTEMLPFTHISVFCEES